MWTQILLVCGIGSIQNFENVLYLEQVTSLRIAVALFTGPLNFSLKLP